MSLPGFTIWFTGLPCSGKSTISLILAEIIRRERGKIEIMDGDVVRTNLSKGLGFSREDRETNLKRIAFVCNLLSRNEVPVIAAATSPFENQLRDQAWLDLKDEFPLAELRRCLIFRTRPVSAPRSPRLES